MAALSALPRPLRLHDSLLLGLAAVVVVVLLTPSDWRWPSRAALGWDVGVAVFLAISVFKIMHARSTDDIRKRAADLDDAGSAVLPLSLLAAVASIAIVIGEAATAPKSEAAISAVMTLTTLALSWCFIHLIFAEHYAHGFYAPADETEIKGGKKTKASVDRGGLIFPGEDEPDYWDFIHFAMIIGVANQTADIQISDRRLRRLSSIQSVTAFVFNTVILALGVNLAVSFIGA